MKLFNFAVILAALIILQFSSVLPSLAAANKTVAGDDLKPLKNIIISTDKSIKIEVKDATLYDTLKAVTRESEIKFEVTEELLKNKISARVKSDDWPGAMKKLLQKYNYANSWRGDKLVKIFIFERGSGKSIELRPPTAVPPLPEPEGSSSSPAEIPENGSLPEPNVPAEMLPVPDVDSGQMVVIEDGMAELEFPDNPDLEKLDEPEGPPDPTKLPVPELPSGTMPE